MRKLTPADIVDLAAYERERATIRARIIELKRGRRVPLGDLMTITFENTETMRFQVQEMARAERMTADQQIAREIDTYNELIPGDGELTGTLFIEINEKALLREWLPKLTGIQRHVGIRLAGGALVRGVPVSEDLLTREASTTTTVHYLRFPFPPDGAAALRAGPARLLADHPNYRSEAELGERLRVELAGDLAPTNG